MYKKITPNPLTLKSLIDYSTTHFSGNTAVSFVEGNATMKYAELGAKINEMAGLLYSFGLQPGDNVALYCQNMPNWVVAYFAVVARGLVIVPILPDFTRAEVENVLLHSESKVLFVSDRLKSKTDGLELPDLKAKILVDDFSIIQGEITAAKPENLNDIEVKEEDIAAIIYTSGTTGRSKGVVLTQKNITFVAMQSYTVFPINEHDIFLSFLPLSHTYENSIGMLYPLSFNVRSINILSGKTTNSSFTYSCNGQNKAYHDVVGATNYGEIV